MLKTIAKTLILGCLFYSLLIVSPFLSATSSAVAYPIQKENTIILEMGSASSDDIKDLRYSEGKLFSKIAKALEQLKESGEVGENAQPIIVVVKKKSSRDW